MMDPLDRRALLAGATVAALATPAQPTQAPSPRSEKRGAAMNGFSAERRAEGAGGADGNFGPRPIRRLRIDEVILHYQ